MPLFVEYLQRSEALLIVEVTILCTHITLDVDFGIDFSFGGAAAGQEGLDLRSVLIEVVVIDVLDPVDVEDRRLVKVVTERHWSFWHADQCASNYILLETCANLRFNFEKRL